MLNSLRNSANNWMAKKMAQQSTFYIPLSNVYSKTGTNIFSRKIKYDEKLGNFRVGRDRVGSEKTVI